MVVMPVGDGNDIRSGSRNTPAFGERVDEDFLEPERSTQE